MKDPRGLGWVHRLPPHGRTGLTVHCCEECGLVYAPRNAPPACPDCGGPLEVRRADAALAIAAARRGRLKAQAEREWLARIRAPQG